MIAPKQIALESAYTPSKWGAEFHMLTHDYALGAGCAGPGKSMVLLMDPFEQIISEHDRCYRRRDHDFPLNWGESIGWALHMRRQLPMLSQTLQRAQRIFPAIDPGVKWSASELMFTFSSGYRYQFGHCNDSDDWQKYYSSEFSYIAWDELTQFEEEQWNQVNSRKRSSDPVLRQKLKVRAMSNPVTQRDSNYSVSDPDWVRKLFVDPAPNGRQTLVRELKRGSGELVRETRIYLPAKLSDNPDKEFAKSYEATLLGMPPHMRKALLEGNWYFTKGSHFTQWDNDYHVVKAFKIPPHWPVFRSMDWGFKKPGCVHWWTMDEEENLYCIFELTFQGKPDNEVAREIKKVERELKLLKRGSESTLTGPADNQLWENRGESAKSKAAVMSENGVNWVRADKRSRRRNSELLSKRLSDHGALNSACGIQFFECCQMAIKTIPAVQTAVEGTDKGEVPKDGGDDHWLDSVLYACAYASRGRAGLMNASSSEEDEKDEDEATSGWERQRREKRGRDGYGSRV